MKAEDSVMPLLPTQQDELAQLYEKTHRPLFRYCQRLTRNDADAEDLKSETYFQVGKQYSRVDHPLSLEIAYLKKIAKHLFLRKWIGDRWRQILQEKADPVENEGRESDFLDQLSLEQYKRVQADYREKYQLDQYKYCFRQALSRLAKEERDLLLQWAEESLSLSSHDVYKAMADATGKERALITYQVNLAKSKLRYHFKVLLNQRK